jgi:hypothetical protein
MSELDKISPKFPTIHLGGKDRELCYGFKFFSDLIKNHGDIQTGLKPFTDMADGNINAEALFDMVYKALYYDEEITAEDVRKWMNSEIRSMGKIKGLFAKIRSAIEESMKDDSGDPTNPVRE